MEEQRRRIMPGSRGAIALTADAVRTRRCWSASSPRSDAAWLAGLHGLRWQALLEHSSFASADANYAVGNTAKAAAVIFKYGP
jgi:hypothetical protein